MPIVDADPGETDDRIINGFESDACGTEQNGQHFGANHPNQDNDRGRTTDDGGGFQRLDVRGVFATCLSYQR